MPDKPFDEALGELLAQYVPINSEQASEIIVALELARYALKDEYEL